MSYAWYRFKGKVKKVYKEHHRSLECELTPNEVFGIKRIGKKFKLVDSSDLSALFTLNPKEAENLLKRSKGYGGKINGVKAPKGAPYPPKKSSTPKGNSLTITEATPPKEPITNKDGANALRKLIKIKYAGLSRSKLLTVTDFDSEKRFMIDVTPALRAYMRTNKQPLSEAYNIWADELEEVIEKAIPKSIAEIEAIKGSKGNWVYTLTLVLT